MFSEHKYPSSSEELATEYAQDPIDMPNETESIGSVFDRLEDERYDTAEEAEEAFYNELTGSEAGPEEYNNERDLTEVKESIGGEEDEDQPSGPM